MLRANVNVDRQSIANPCTNGDNATTQAPHRCATWRGTISILSLGKGGGAADIEAAPLRPGPPPLKYIYVRIWFLE